MKRSQHNYITVQCCRATGVWAASQDMWRGVTSPRRGVMRENQVISGSRLDGQSSISMGSEVITRHIFVSKHKFISFLLKNGFLQLLESQMIRPNGSKCTEERSGFLFEGCFCSVKKYVTLALFL